MKIKNDRVLEFSRVPAARTRRAVNNRRLEKRIRPKTMGATFRPRGVVSEYDRLIRCVVSDALQRSRVFRSFRDGFMFRPAVGPGAPRECTKTTDPTPANASRNPTCETVVRNRTPVVRRRFDTFPSYDQNRNGISAAHRAISLGERRRNSTRQPVWSFSFCVNTADREGARFPSARKISSFFFPNVHFERETSKRSTWHWACDEKKARILAGHPVHARFCGSACRGTRAITVTFYTRQFRRQKKTHFGHTRSHNRRSRCSPVDGFRAF